MNNPKIGIKLRVKKENIIKEKIITGKSYITLKGDEILTYKEHKDMNGCEDEKFIFYVQFMDDNKIFIHKIITQFIPYKDKKQTEELDNNLWYLLNLEENNKYYLKEKDIIKFGSKKYIVHKISLSENINENKKKDEKEIKYENINDNYESPFINKPEEITRCKLCDSFNLNICECGSLHLPCVSKYLSTYINKYNGKNVITFFIDNYNCIKCKTSFPFEIQGQQIIKLGEITFKNYIILGTFENKINDGVNKKYLYIIDLSSRNNIKIGKDENNNLIFEKIKDELANIKLDEDNNVVLEKLSKNFNISILIRRTLALNNKKIDLITGNYFLEVQRLNKIIES